MRVADRGAELLAMNLAPHAVITGGFGKLTQSRFHMSEARLFANRIQEHGIDSGRLFLEEKSTNTGDNIRFSMELLKKQKSTPTSVILVQKPYLERRAYATCKCQYPALSVMTTSPVLDFNTYVCEGELPVEDVIGLIVGDTERVLMYPKLGFQIPQDMPQEVYDAYLQLRDTYTAYRITTG